MLKTGKFSLRASGSLPAESDRGARFFVWSVWLLMMLVVLFCLVKYSRNIPFSEDWYFVPAMTGNEANLLDWLWSQNNEHRIPLPRLILLVLLKATNGDFRTGMLFNVILTGALAAAMILVARCIRGSRTCNADALFPIALLHLGHWENLFWCWQATFVIPLVLVGALFLAFVRYPTLSNTGAAAVAGISLPLLPLCGANGLLFVPGFMFLCIYCGIIHWRHDKKNKSQPWLYRWLIGSSLLTLGITALYLVGLERASDGYPSANLLIAVQSAIKFLALSLGPAVRSSWGLSMIIIIGILLPFFVFTVSGIIRYKEQEKNRVLVFFIFFVNVVVIAIAIGWGRTEVIKLWGGVWPARYSFIALPALLAAYFFSVLFGPQTYRKFFQLGLLLVMCLLIPLNTINGFWWREIHYGSVVEPLRQDLLAKKPFTEVAKNNEKLLKRMGPDAVQQLKMLYDVHIGPSTRIAEVLDTTIPMAAASKRRPSGDRQPVSSIKESVFTTEIRYAMPEAESVSLLWGINGWGVAPEKFRPPGTLIKNKIMHTPMVKEAGFYIVRISLPAGATIHYGFLTKIIPRFYHDISWEIWDDKNYHSKNNPISVDDNRIVEVQGRLNKNLVVQEIRYDLPEAEEITLIWGLNGWNIAPEKLRPAGTIIKNDVMHTPMIKKSSYFIAKIFVPVGIAIHYGFLIEKRQGVLDIVYPIFDSSADARTPLEDNVVEHKGAVDLFGDLSHIDTGFYILLGVFAVFCLSFLVNRSAVIYDRGKCNLDKRKTDYELIQ
jgi:hypothetical protein